MANIKKIKIGNTSYDIKDASAVHPSDLATVATSGSYNDLTDKPYIPSGVVVDQTFDATSQNAQSGIAIAGKLADYAETSDLAEVATTGDYDDLTNKPTIPTVPTTLSSFTDNLGSNPVHTHSQYLTSHQDISGKVSKSGDTMTGALGITANVKYPLGVSSDVTDANLTEEYLLIKDTSMNLTDTPSANRILGVRGSFNDSAIGDVRFAKLTDGSTISRFVVFNSISGNVINAQFGVNINASGNATLTIPAYAIHNQLTTFAFPSSTSQNLSVPASGGTVTAPDYGWIVFTHRISNSGSIIGLGSNKGLRSFHSAVNNNQLLRTMIPVSKADIVTVEYSSSNSNTSSNSFIFVKAIGATY